MRTIRQTSRLSADAFERGSAGRKLVLQPFKAAVKVVDAIDHSLALGRERGDHERYRCAQIGRHHLCPLELIDTLYGRDLARKLNTSAKPRQLLHVHEAVLENGLGDT